jgi:hypothetical protein
MSQGMWLDRRVSLERELRNLNRNMIAFDLVLGSGAVLAPAATLRVLGHNEPSDDARELFRRCGPIWLTFAAAHLIAYQRTGGRSRGCAARSSPPTCSGRDRRRFHGRARGPECGSQARETP